MNQQDNYNLPEFIYLPLAKFKKYLIVTSSAFNLRYFHGLKKFGKNVIVSPGFSIFSGVNSIFIGNNVWLNDVLINAGSFENGKVTIEDNVFFGHRCMLLARSHDYNLKGLKRIQSITAKDITIKNGAWISSGVIILPGVIVGENSVIAAGSIVTKNVPKNTIYAGIPAKKIKDIL